MTRALVIITFLASCGGSLESSVGCPLPSEIDPSTLQGTVTYPAVLPDCICDRWSRGEVVPVLTSTWSGGCYYAWETTETCGECSRVIDFVYQRGEP